MFDVAWTRDCLWKGKIKLLLRFLFLFCKFFNAGVLIGTPHVAIPSVGPEIGAASSGNNLELNTERE